MIEDIFAILTNKIVISCVLSLIVAQLIKFTIHYFKTGKFDIGIFLYQAGGMPSSHAAPVTALAFAVYLDQGITSLFIVASVFAIVVMRDATGVRWVSGEHSIVINKIIKSLKTKKLKPVEELAGHTPVQVLAGALLGIAITSIIYVI